MAKKKDNRMFIEHLTAGEARQKRVSFKQAGYKAFGLGVHFNDNPYTRQPFKDLWSDGYRSAKRAYEAANPRGRERQGTR
jgi:hypothetical protein